jgi:hypothetical protein
MCKFVGIEMNPVLPHGGGDHGVDYCENSRPESTDLDPSPTRCTHSVTDTRESVCELPPYDGTTDPHFVWGELDGETFAHSVDCCYAEIVHWRRNLFKIPSGKSGKSFVRELTRLFRAFGDNSALECVALKAAMVLPALLLQKPHARSKAKDHSTHLERRLKLWEKGDIDTLVIEGRTIQRKLEKKTYVKFNTRSSVGSYICKAHDGGKGESCSSNLNTREQWWSSSYE